MIDHIYKNKLTSTLSQIYNKDTAVTPSFKEIEDMLGITLAEYQNHIISSALHNDHTLVLKGRQVGGTTCLLATALTTALKEKNTILFVTMNAPMAKNAFGVLKSICLQKGLNASITNTNIILTNGSVIKVTHYSDVQLMSSTLPNDVVDYILCDEVSTVRELSLFSEFLRILKPTGKTLMVTGVNFFTTHEPKEILIRDFLKEVWYQQPNVVKFYLPSSINNFVTHDYKRFQTMLSYRTYEREFEARWD